MIRSKLGRFLRFIREDLFPVLFGLLVICSFFFSGLIFAYHVCRGWIILFTGDTSFLPPLDILFASWGLV